MSDPLLDRIDPWSEPDDVVCVFCEDGEPCPYGHQQRRVDHYFASLDRATLEKIRRDPTIGEHMRERISAVLDDRAPAPPSSAKHPGSRMNKTETRWTQILEAEKAAGEIVGYDFESVRFRLGHAMTFTPDFVVRLPNGRLRADEIKGSYIREDARIKFKIAPELYPWVEWRMLQWKGGEWRIVYRFPAKD